MRLAVPLPRMFWSFCPQDTLFGLIDDLRVSWKQCLFQHNIERDGGIGVTSAWCRSNIRVTRAFYAPRVRHSHA